jgi:hypothetical protein
MPVDSLSGPEAPVLSEAKSSVTIYGSVLWIRPVVLVRSFNRM